ncbi:hypothetical protein [Kitasatospora paracochleata]|uniref:Uncharacterized protein n=2 Tax=Kitasatospora paracochleata TaxID=58354 RepID=A0ABT1JCK0_9ACTN|nr:hypothetical protein [Kitasatospora paracochleata]MCP2314441.1 hypothetical protein [Kitasatospora paracochleata]
MSDWWGRRRDALLIELAEALAYFGAELLEDPGAGELARAARALAREYRASDRGHPVRQVGELLAAAAADLRTADRLRGTLLPVVTHHLRRSALHLAAARSHLRRPVPAGPRSVGHEPHTERLISADPRP